ncbi:MAG: helix-turn-helix transcriptional regulator [Lachnospiraceae bacterium]|nr:helix-turn-helix transcriptional regulator [Lachnospiraceae bacterium]
MNFGQVLTDLRVEKGIYQKELASYLNVTIGTISNYENGVHYPDLSTLCQIADYFHVTTDYLLGRTRYPHDLETLNRPLSKDYTIADLVNTTLELSPQNVSSMLDYVELLKLRQKQ